jgi:hypothetical protein
MHPQSTHSGEAGITSQRSAGLMIGRLFGRPIPAPVALRQALPAGLREELDESVVLRAGRWVPRIGGILAGSRYPAAAVTLGRNVIVHPDARLTARLVRHELEHVRQWQRRPVTFPLHYAWLYLRHGYRANPYEVAARQAESELLERGVSTTALDDDQGAGGSP